MKWSKFYLFTLREDPSDAELVSHKLLVRGGYISKLDTGVYTYGSLALRALRKFEKIVREELDARGCIELLMPMVQPQSLWEETKRWLNMGPELLKFKNRSDHGFCLGPTHEEVITDLVRRDVKSYKSLPFILYQIQTKYRDEIRPRFGLMRAREFIMKDAYSFDIDSKGALKNYELMYDAYKAIFKRLGVEFRVVKADTGAIGGNLSHEFQVLAEAGEDHLMICQSCDFAANIEVAPVVYKQDCCTSNVVDNNNTTNLAAAFPASDIAVEAFHTPGIKTISELSKFAGVPSEQLVKTLFFSISPNSESGEDCKQGLTPIAVLLRGCDEVNLVKLKNFLNLNFLPTLLEDKDVYNITGAHVGSCGPIGLKIPIYVDEAVSFMKSFIVGANKDDYHLRNVCLNRDFKTLKVADLRLALDGDACPQCNGTYKSMRGIEVGHVFYLGTEKYSKSMSATVLNASGKHDLIEMGCYGIGISRSMQAVVEQSHDKDGIIWPISIAPFQVHICLLDITDESVCKIADDLYVCLQKHGVDVFLDDRNERPGVKFKDADLLGMPLRVTIGRKCVENQQIDIIERKSKNVHKVSISDALSWIFNWINVSHHS